jgi:hypothetical protein
MNNAGIRLESSRTRSTPSATSAAAGQSLLPASPRLRNLVSMAYATGGVVRDMVFVTLDALRGRYDH